MDLSFFQTKSLFEATTTLFDQLGIRLNSATANGLDAMHHLKEHYKKAFDGRIKDGKFYFVGRVDDSIFSAAQATKVTLEQATETDYEGLIVLALELNGYPKRAEISALARAFNRLSLKVPVALLLKYEMEIAQGQSETAISIAISERFQYLQTWRKGEKAGKVVILRDIRTVNTHAGYIKILQDLHEKTRGISTFRELKEKWQEVLDVNVLNKQFYKELSAWYYWASGIVKFPDDLEKREDIRNSINLIRLITRLIFIWFLKEMRLVPASLFDPNSIKTVVKDFNKPKSCHYYTAILQNLFFATLNQKMADRAFANEGSHLERRDHYSIKNLYRYHDQFLVSPDEAMELFKAIPFLNGGLFDCLDKEDKERKVQYVDGFSRNPKKKAIIPDHIFFSDKCEVDLNSHYGTRNATHTVMGLVKILDRYKFTITENTPHEEEVALDPELLGKVFENLLASYNPETQTTARNQTGSFYTPREIVDFMAEETLIAHLSEKLGPDSQEKLPSLFSFEEGNPFDTKGTLKLIEAIDTLKILDPACGTGAFPMGVLHKLVFALTKLDPDNLRWKELQREKAIRATDEAYAKVEDKDDREVLLKEINNVFDNNASDYGRKLYLVENCIHGVDTQPIAVQIAKLRFFISLIIEQNPDAKKDNFGIRSLPNLETKFVAADSLIALQRTGQSSLLRSPEVESKERELKGLRQKYFTANTRGKKDKLQEKDAKLREEIAGLLVAEGWEPGETQKIAAFDPYNQNATADWFDPEWMFNVVNGFDIVIGNPPYIQLQNNGGALANKYQDQDYKTFARTGDIYALFYERGHQLLKDGKYLCYITSNKWMRAGYGESLRGFFASRTHPLTLIDFAGQKIFESATVDTNILLFKKTGQANTLPTKAAVATEDCRNDLSDFVRQKAVQCIFSGGGSWVVLSPIEQAIKAKIEKAGKPLKDWDISINYGIKTGYNDAFIIKEAKREEILANCRTAEERKRTDELIRPILRGRDIKRYSYDWAGLYLIASHNGIPDKDIPRIDIGHYPAVKRHLDLHWDRIERRSDQGDTPYNLRSCAYMEDFSKPKIVWGEISDKTKFALDANGDYYNEATTFLLIGANLSYLLCYLNSSLSEYLFSKLGTTTGVGTALRANDV